ncbi:MAG: putative endonuclease [Candidatus Omnitrophota bacterium]
MEQKNAYTYIMTNQSNSVLYTGVTSDLVKRVFSHKQKTIDGFSKKYNTTKLIYYELFDDILTAIEREKQIKKYKRSKKIKLIESTNSNFKDLCDGLL